MECFQCTFNHMCGSAGKESLRPTGIPARLHSAPASEIMAYHLFDGDQCATVFSVRRQEGLECSVVTNQF